MSSLSASPFKVSLPVPPSIWSLPLPPLTMSWPPRPSRLSFPPLPLMVSSPLVPLMVLLPLEPLKVATSHPPQLRRHAGARADGEKSARFRIVRPLLIFPRFSRTCCSPKSPARHGNSLDFGRRDSAPSPLRTSRVTLHATTVHSERGGDVSRRAQMPSSHLAVKQGSWRPSFRRLFRRSDALPATLGRACLRRDSRARRRPAGHGRVE